MLRAFLPLRVDSSLQPIAQRYWWTVPIVAGLGFLTSLLEGLGISLLIPLLSTLMSSTPVRLPGPLAILSTLAEHYDPDTRLILIGATILFCVIVKAVVDALNAIFIAWVDARASHEVRVALAHRLLNVGYPFYLEQDVARLLNIVSTDSWRASDAIKTGFRLVASVAAALVLGLFLLAANWKLTLIVAAGALVVRSIQDLFARWAQALSRDVSATNLRLGARMLHTVQAMRLIRVFSQEHRELREFEAASELVKKAMLGLEGVRAAVAGIVESAYSVFFVGLLIGGYFAGVALPVLVTFLVLLFRLQPFLRSISDSRMSLAAMGGSVAEVEWLLDARGKPAPPSGQGSLRGADQDIVFDGVSFAYSGAERSYPALRNVSFTIRRGRIAALIGPSGSGKSTVINLICRLLDPSDGHVLVGDRNLREIDPVAWRSRIGFAGQDIDLFDGTVAENIAYGAENASIEQIEEAARLADIHEFINSLPRGYQTEVGTAGLRLSGGQRQRVGLARAFVRKPDLLILDEATSAVDVRSEESILKLVKNSSWMMTTLVVSHRTSTVAGCDDRIELAAGQIVSPP